MALQRTSLLSSSDITASIRLVPKKTKVVKFATGTALLARGTPVAYDNVNDEWVPWDHNTSTGDINTMRGFVFGDPVQLNATDEVHGVILSMGEVNRNDVNTAAIRALLPDSPTEANVDDGLRGEIGSGPSLRELGIAVEGLNEVR